MDGRWLVYCVISISSQKYFTYKMPLTFLMKIKILIRASLIQYDAFHLKHTVYYFTASQKADLRIFTLSFAVV